MYIPLLLHWVFHNCNLFLMLQNIDANIVMMYFLSYDVFLLDDLVLSYPHFGPKNTHSNFSVIFWYFQIHRVFYCASNAHFTVTISNRHTSKAIQSVFLHYKSSKRVSRTIACFPTFYSNFCIKSYKRVFWSFPTKEPILVPTICPWVFSICLHESFVKFCTKSS